MRGRCLVAQRVALELGAGEARDGLGRERWHKP